MFDLGTAPGAYSSYGRGINNNGQVVGTNFYGTLADRAFIYTGGAMHDLGTLADPADNTTFSRAYGINNAGDVTGVSGTGGVAHPFLYRNGSLYDIGTLGGNMAGGYAINNNGQIAGYSTVASGETHAFLYSNFVMQDLGTLPGRQSYAVALNDFGVAVGFSQSLTDETAFIAGAGQLIELNSLIDPLAGWYIAEATGINNAGQISATAGRVGDLTYQSFAVRLDPIIDTQVGGVPEPASWALMIAGFAMVGAAQRRRSRALPA
jgi:probable HAF family extracellular repeat protein